MKSWLCGKAECSKILALFALTWLIFRYLANSFIAPTIHLFINRYSQATAQYSPKIHLYPKPSAKIHNEAGETLSHSVLRSVSNGPGNPAAVRVWTAETGRFSSRPGQKPDPLTLGGPNPDLYPSTRGFRPVWLYLSVPISGSAFLVSHLWSHSDMLLWIVKYWHGYCTLHFQCISRHDVEKKHTHAPNHILTMRVKRASTIFGLASSVIWVELDHKHP